MGFDGLHLMQGSALGCSTAWDHWRETAEEVIEILGIFFILVFQGLKV